MVSIYMYTNSTFLNNKWAAIEVSFVKRFVFESCLVADNRDCFGTLTIFDVSESLISNCIFMNNRADLGGAVKNIDSNIRITDSVFKGNQATKSGGTIHSTGFNGYISLRNVLVSASAASKRVLGTLVYCETYIHTENVSLIAYNNTETSPIFIYSSRSRLTRLTTIKGITLSCQVGNKVEYLINTKSRIVTYNVLILQALWNRQIQFKTRTRCT